MRRSRNGLAAAAIALSTTSAWATEAEPVWELDGFANPEAVLLSSDGAFLYVTNMSGGPAEKNGAGYISRVSLDGQLLEEKWAVELDAPKGLVEHAGRLYVSDIDRLVAIDTTSGKILEEWPNQDAAFLNGLTADDRGRIYVSDTLRNAIFRLDGDVLEVWVEGKALGYPNGLRFEDGRILIAGWGKPNEDFTTDVPGHLKAVDIESLAITSVGDGTPIGNLDGIRSDGQGGWLLTDFVGGAIIRVASDGATERLLELDAGSADLEFLAAERLAIVPMLLDGRVAAYRVD